MVSVSSAQNKPKVYTCGKESYFPLRSPIHYQIKEKIYCTHCYIPLNGIGFLLTIAKAITHIELIYLASFRFMLRRLQTSHLCRASPPLYSLHYSRYIRSRFIKRLVGYCFQFWPHLCGRIFHYCFLTLGYKPPFLACKVLVESLLKHPPVYNGIGTPHLLHFIHCTYLQHFFFYIHVTLQRNKFLYNKTNRCTNFPNLFRLTKWTSTCFG